MPIDIHTFDISSMILEKLTEALGELKEVPSKVPAMDKLGETKWYEPGERARASFQSLRVQTIRDIEIKNFFDREKFDMCNSFIVTLTPSGSLPLPQYAADVDVHKGKYVHVITDLIPFSKNPEYLKKYEEPVKQLREKYAGLPGLVTETSEEIYRIYPALKQFEAFASSGMIFGNIPIERGSRIIDLLSDYIELYKTFIRNSPECALLKNESIQKEAAETLGKFMLMMSRIDFSDDIAGQSKT
jgi:hypothetical protein